MIALWRRFWRLWREPRIRLPGPGLRPGALRRGDRLQIGSQLWRIESRPDAGAVFGLVAAEEPSVRAWLRVVAGHWTLADDADNLSRGVDLDLATVMHFPVTMSAPCMEDDCQRAM